MRMIICDDHAVFAESLSLVLADAGHSVVGVTYSPADAMPLLRARQPDACLIDLQFPSGTALDWMPRLRASSPRTRFVVLTGYLEQPVLDAGVAAGVRGFAHKGQQAGDILAVLRRVADGEVVVDQVAARGGGAAQPGAEGRAVPHAPGTRGADAAHPRRVHPGARQGDGGDAQYGAQPRAERPQQAGRAFAA